MNHYPVAHLKYQTEITLPIYYNLDDDQVQLVIDAVISSVKVVLSE